MEYIVLDDIQRNSESVFQFNYGFKIVLWLQIVVFNRSHKDLAIYYESFDNQLGSTLFTYNMVIKRSSLFLLDCFQY